MASIQDMLNFMYNHQKHLCKVRYSMGSDRYFNPNADCSSSVYFALKAGGFLLPSASIGNTETLFKLNGKIFKELSSLSSVKPGDIFILGGEGRSNGAYGHTGFFIGNGNIIHCNYHNNGITINNLYTVLSGKRSYKERYFRPIDPNNKEEINNISTPKFIKYEKAKATFLATIYIRDYPSTKKGSITGKVRYGDVRYYKAVYENDGYRWIEFINYEGQSRFIAYRTLANPNYVWAKFE